jgi:hypothetical protein
MKNLCLFIIIIFLIFPLKFTSAQTDSNTTKFSQRIPPDLEIEVKITAESAIAYANCFLAKVLSVNKGTLSDSVIFITVLPKDTENYNILSSKGEDEVFRIFCMFNKSDEPYHSTFITGFVDSRKTSWKIIAIYKK